MNQDKLRSEYKAYFATMAADPSCRLPFPSRLRGLQCGARAKSTRQPCKRKDLYGNGRCKLHGGLSTGPKTAEGKHRSASNGLKGGRPKKQTP